jgi:hypothetical protein
VLRLYTAYREWRSEIFSFGEMLGSGAPAAPGYPGWRSAESEFLAELRKKIEIPELRTLKTALRSMIQTRAI